MQRRHVLSSLLLWCCLLLTGGTATAADETGEGVLLAAFGTGEPEAYKAYEAIEAAYTAEKTTAVRAFTSEIIRKKTAEIGKPVYSVAEALDELHRRGIRKVTVQSLHVGPGEEFSYLERVVLRELLTKPDRFVQVRLARPLLESRRDMEEVVDAVLRDAAPRRRPGQALVLMAHGQSDGRCDLTWAAVRAELTRRDPLAFLATVEGNYAFDDVLAQLKEKKVESVLVQPFMVVAGDHARNDMSGSEEDSWTSLLAAAGIKSTAALKGLGEIEGVRAVFLRHTGEAKDDLAAPRKK